MFSCCRANTKSSKKSKKVNDNSKKQQQQQQSETNEENDASSKNVKKKLIIPTITIENGKTIENLLNNEQENGKSENCVTDNLNDKITTTIIVTEAIENENSLEKEADIVNEQATPIAAVANEAETVKQTAEINVDSVNISHPNDAEIISCKSLENTNNSIDVEAISYAATSTYSHENASVASNFNQTNDCAAAAIPLATQSASCDNTNDTNIVNNEKPKSCLSRHNSTHTSVKKRVNISVHAEIIETDPSLPTAALPLTSSIGDEEDDVFSDSVPPPKRESMCAPYVERDINSADVVSESIVYAHGLPEWFDDERINDV